MGTLRKLIKAKKTLAIMPTYQCTSECKDCGTLSSPRNKIHLSLDIMLSAIKQAKKLGFYNIVFTGGEPTLRYEDLLQCISCANSLDMPTRIVTNAHWAKSVKIAKEKIDDLLKAGLNEINYSTGDEHIRFVPKARIINATVAALEKGIRLDIMIELKSERKITKDDILSNEKIIELNKEKNKILSISESPWMPLNPYKQEKYPDGMCANKSNLGMRKGCETVLQTYVLQADGNITACCGLGMCIIPELIVSTIEDDKFIEKAIMKAESDFLKVWLRYIGPEKILDWAAEKDLTIKWENRYAHPCHACIRLYKDPKVRKIILENHAENYLDVLQRMWLEEEFVFNELRDSNMRVLKKSKIKQNLERVGC